MKLSIDGTATMYVDRNERLDVGDRLLKSTTLFDDANRNGMLDLGEVSLRSAKSGNVRFGNLPIAVNIARLRALS